MGRLDCHEPRLWVQRVAHFGVFTNRSSRDESRLPISNYFWNCACLINDSGNTIVAEDSEDEDDVEENIKTQGTDYTKLARGISKMKDEGVNISLVDINKSQYTLYQM